MTETLRLADEDVIGLDLVELVSDGSDPAVFCAEERRDSCAYKREYDQTLSKYNIDRLMRWPECEACGCSLLVESP